ncbi:hypothetical protein [Ancylobacter terrae]|uniref:hypothetical protein n=1 Tax=Ancylobacter sp. sgz301288 TaxID=3342077 RepID=UPI0038598B43
MTARIGTVRSIAGSAVLVLACLLAQAGIGRAGTTGNPVSMDVGMSVPGSPGTTALDLLRQILPDLVLEAGKASGTLPEHLRSLTRPEPGERASQSVAVSAVQALHFDAEGHEMLAILADLGSDEDEARTLLAVFEPRPAPRLVDAAALEMDRFTGFSEPARLDIGRRDQALVIRSEHFNSSQSYVTTALVFLRKGHLEMVDTFFTFGTRYCGWEEAQTLGFGTRPAAPGSPYRSIVARVTDRRTSTEPACEGERRPKPFRRVVETSYRWDARLARFRPRSDALKGLEAAAEQRF